MKTVFQFAAFAPVIVRVATSSTVNFSVVPSASRSIENLCHPGERAPPELFVSQFIHPMLADGYNTRN